MAQSRVRLPKQVNCIRVVLALNPDIESQGEADERWVKIRLHSSYPWPGRASDKEVWVQKMGTLLHIWLTQQRSWVNIHNASTQGVWAKWMTHWIAGDGLHISFIYRLPHRGLFLLCTKDKQTQALPLKEGFRQVPAQVTGQVFQTTWSQRNYTSMLKQPSKRKSKFKVNLSN